ncbi:MAG: NAD(P)/FAD-dependent oxidoreductase [Clostridia bacterium]|nr:NAD(P)/FAD-dependent oxidoreductase [Clostridia bacterium]
MRTVCISAKKSDNKGAVLVIGGGPAGLMAALFAARAGARVTLLERNEKLGKKLYITGKGRCNVTNTADFDDFFRQVPRNPRFLQAAVRGFSQANLRALLQEWGVPTVEERGGRVFPASQKASDVTRALTRALEAAGVGVRLNARVGSILPMDDGVRVVLENGEAIIARAVVIATGGASYPATGSTGDGYAFAGALGHTVFPPLPSLVPLITRERWPTQLQGLALKNVRLSARLDGKIVFSELGEMLFTHFGISGPLVLELSSHVPADRWKNCEVWLDTKPGLEEKKLDARLLRDFEAASRRQLRHALPGLLPARLADMLPSLCDIPAEKPVHQVTKDERRRLCALLKALPLPIIGTRPVAEAIITRGGVEVKEINPSTMESKRVPGVYFAGEVIDVDAHTGGYNLQIAFSTGALAGASAARYVNDGRRTLP